jgi:flagellar hook-associated protein 1
MTLASALSIGASGLRAANFGSQVASQNISNATTPGYTRQAPDIESIPIDQGGGAVGTGSTRVQDQFLERRALGASSYNGEADARVKTLSVLDTVFADGQGTVGEALDAFDSSLSDLAATPNSTPVRQVALSRADDLAQSFHRASDALTGARVDANSRISDAVGQVNEQADEVGQLSTEIVAAKASGGDASTLEDKRDVLIRSISAAVPVTVIPKDSGAVTLMISGARTLVAEDSSVHHLIASPDATTGDVRIMRQTAGATEDITSFFTTGSIGGTVAARDGALTDARNALDQLATDVTTGYNTVHAAGVGLDGTTGRNLFSVSATVTGAAGNMSVSSDVAGHPEFVAAATSATSLPSDNRNALLLQDVRDQKLGLGGTVTLQQSFSSMVSAGGTAAKSANDQSTQAAATLGQIDSLRDSVSGVSTDDEMINLMKFQRAYQASLRVIETADSMMSDLMNMRFGG